MNISFLADGTGDIGSNLSTALSSTSLWTAICKTIIIIFIGYFLTRKNIFPKGTGSTLTKVVMNVALPCLAFTGFMSDFTMAAGIDAIFNFIFGFVIYIIFMMVSKVLFLWVKDPTKRTVLCILFAFGSTTFFAQPLIQAVFPGNNNLAYNNSNMLNVAYRVFLYSYAYISIAGIKLGSTKETSLGVTIKKILLNPIIIATFAGLILWFLQAIPGTDIVRTDWLSQTSASYEEAKKVAFWRIDVTLPWIYQVAKTLGSLSSPLVWLAIGCTLGNASIGEAAKDKMAWIYSAMKVFLAPCIVLLVLVVIELIAKACGYPQLVSLATVQSSVMMWMVPPATVAVAYCINFDKEKQMASNISVISTLVAVFGIVIWVLLLTVIESFGFFYVA
ncbi:MAG: AEC family transporter [Bacilli bacterium]